MRLNKARITNYRSIRDTGLFEIEQAKTILVGPNEAGKTALLQALQRINAPDDIPGFDPLRDYPRAIYNDITTGKIDPSKLTVVEAHFRLEDQDKSLINEAYRDCTYVYGRKLNNEAWHRLEGGPETITFGKIKKDLLRLCSHTDSRHSQIDSETDENAIKPSEKLKKITESWQDETLIIGEKSVTLMKFLDEIFPLIEEDNSTEENRYDRIYAATNAESVKDSVLKTLSERIPLFVLFSNYFRALLSKII